MARLTHAETQKRIRSLHAKYGLDMDIADLLADLCTADHEIQRLQTERDYWRHKVQGNSRSSVVG